MFSSVFYFRVVSALRSLRYRISKRKTRSVVKTSSGDDRLDQEKGEGKGAEETPVGGRKGEEAINE